MSEYIFVTNIFEYSNIFVTLCFRMYDPRFYIEILDFTLLVGFTIAENFQV